MLLDDDRYRCDGEQQEQALPRDGQSFESYPGHFARLFLLMAEKYEYVRLRMQVEKLNDRYVPYSLPLGSRSKGENGQCLDLVAC
jgi:hypothetical protein